MKYILWISFFVSPAFATQTIECASPWLFARHSQASLSFELGSDGLPIKMISRFNTATGEVAVNSTKTTIPDDGDWIYLTINENTANKIVLRFASPEYTKASAAKLELVKGDITSFPNVKADTKVEIRPGNIVTVGNGLLTGMNCQLQ